MSAAVQFLTNEKGKKTAVVLPIEDYEKLQEDLDDLAVIAERRDEETISPAVMAALAEIAADRKAGRLKKFSGKL